MPSKVETGVINVATSQGALKTSGNSETAQNTPVSTAFRREQPCRPLTMSFQPLELHESKFLSRQTAKFVVLGCGCSETDTGGDVSSWNSVLPGAPGRHGAHSRVPPHRRGGGSWVFIAPPRPPTGCGPPCLPVPPTG